MVRLGGVDRVITCDVTKFQIILIKKIKSLDKNCFCMGLYGEIKTLSAHISATNYNGELIFGKWTVFGMLPPNS